MSGSSEQAAVVMLSRLRRSHVEAGTMKYVPRTGVLNGSNC